MQRLILKYILHIYFLDFKINNNLNQIHTIFMNCSILLSCVNKSFCSGMKVIISIEPSSYLVITILNSRTLDNFYWIFVPQLHATGDILNLNGVVSVVLHQPILDCFVFVPLKLSLNSNNTDCGGLASRYEDITDADYFVYLWFLPETRIRNNNCCCQQNETCCRYSW